MSELRRHTMMQSQDGGLPPGYERVNFILSDGLAYIRTPHFYIPSEDTIRVKINPSVTPTWGTPFGYYCGNINSVPTLFRCDNYDGKVNAVYGIDWNASPPTTQINWGDFDEFEFIAGVGLVFHGQQYGVYGNAIIGNNEETAVLFGARYILPNNRRVIPRIAQIFYYEHIRNGVMIFAPVPCIRIADGVVGMYDTAGTICPETGTQFYVNSNSSGSFIAGV